MTSNMYRSTIARRSAVILCAAAGAAGAGCGDRSELNALASGPLYAVSSIITGGDDSNMYISLLGSLEEQTIDYEAAYEFPGTSDFWVYDGAIFVSDFDTKGITRYVIEGGELVKSDEVRFSEHDIRDVAFWNNTFVSAEKAYHATGSGGYIVWNPSTMTITGTMALPAFPQRDGKLTAYPGFGDRSTAVRDGLLYQPIYWADDSFFEYAPDSRIAVFDIATDTLVDVLEAPCPGLDFVSRDQDDNLYFSSWVFAPAGAALLGQAPTCVVKVPAGSKTVEPAMKVSDVTGGREGGALRLLGDGRALLSVLHEEHASSTEIEDVAYGANWRLWSYDLASGQGAVVKELSWNAGATYSTLIDDKAYLSIPTDGYSATDVFELVPGAAPRKIVQTIGWSMRLFKVQ